MLWSSGVCARHRGFSGTLILLQVFTAHKFVILYTDLIHVLRVLDGMGNAAAWGAILSIMMKLYPGNVATIMSSTEMIFGLGYSVGPAIGGSLYDVGGFKLPFITVGSITLVIAIALIYFIPGLL